MSFAWDSKSGAKRWRYDYDESSNILNGVRQPDLLTFESGMLKEGAYYELIGTDAKKRRVIAVHPPDKIAAALRSEFASVLDPTYWLSHHGGALDEFVSMIYDNRKKPSMSKWTVTRRGDVVVMESNRVQSVVRGRASVGVFEFMATC